MSLTIGTIKPHQVEAFHETFKTIAGEGRYLFINGSPDLPAIRRMVAQVLAAECPFVVATQADGSVCGWCCIDPDDASIHSHVGTLTIALLPEFRGRGLGSKLLSAALDKAYRRNLTRIELTVCAGNAPAIRLCEKFSFETEGVKKLSAQIGGELVDVVMMARLSP
ncbi:MAG: GNAT family N-acetyltransferase, partial [Hyphomicrobiales bacterium]|nr:GNAT family N-acetyltransferase [Hyphomicrobiales bacterium]